MPVSILAPCLDRDYLTYNLKIASTNYKFAPILHVDKATAWSSVLFKNALNPGMST